MRAIHRRGLAALTTVACALSLVVSSVGVAQDETDDSFDTPSPFCAVLTAEEASAALGVTLTIGSSSATDCSYDAAADTSTYDVNLIVFRDIGPLTDEYPRAFYPEGVDLEVGGRPAYWSAEDAVLFVDEGANDQLLALQLYGATPEQIDIQAALVSLAEIGLPRLAAIPVPVEPTLEPEPSAIVDEELVALVPTEIEGETVDIETLSGADFLAEIDTTDPEIQAWLQPIQDQLAARGKTIDDLSIAFASYPTELSSGSIAAVRVKGVDITPITQELLPLMLTQPVDEVVQTPATIGGKSVTVISQAASASMSPDASIDPFAEVLPPVYIYPQGEILWFVAADEPGLTEVFQKLP